ncbi:MAG: hypothetical protein ACHQJ6_02955 [Candidatus Berkiellales bacterium]
MLGKNLGEVLAELNAKLDKIEAEYPSFNFIQSGRASTFIFLIEPFLNQSLVFKVMDGGTAIETQLLKEVIHNTPVYTPTKSELEENLKGVQAFILRVENLNEKFHSDANISEDLDTSFMQLFPPSFDPATTLALAATRPPSPSRIEGPAKTYRPSSSQQNEKKEPKKDETKKEAKNDEPTFGGLKKGFFWK